MGTRQRFVSPGFFAAMGIRLLAGRDFTPDDRQGTTPVAIVNRTFVRRYLDGPRSDRRAVLGRLSGDRSAQRGRPIVGVVDDVRQKSLSDAAEPAFYSPLAQFAAAAADDRRRHVAGRYRRRCSRPSATKCASSIRRSPWTSSRRSDIVAGDAAAGSSSGMTLMLIFGVAAVALAAVGIYGVIAYAAAQRRGEIATRSRSAPRRATSSGWC